MISSRFVFYSDTNATSFADDLYERGVVFTTNGSCVTIPDAPEWVGGLALGYSGEELVARAGPADAWSDLQSTAVRSNPPPYARGDPPPDYSAQIVSQRASTFPKRRRTRSQP